MGNFYSQTYVDAKLEWYYIGEGCFPNWGLTVFVQDLLVCSRHFHMSWNIRKHYTSTATKNVLLTWSLYLLVC
jgi:hypothetical protein